MEKEVKKLNEVNLNFKFKTLGGEEINDPQFPTAASLVANLIAMQVDKDEYKDLEKRYSWAKQLYRGEALQLDKPDFDKFKELIKMRINLSDIAKAQIFNVIE